MNFSIAVLIVSIFQQNISPTKLPKKVRTIVADVRDAKKKLSPHQDPRSKASAAIRFAMDNPKKATKKSPSPHTNGSTKKRTLKDDVRKGIAGGLAKKGKDKYFKYFNSNIVADFIINKTFEINNKKKYLWHDK